MALLIWVLEVESHEHRDLAAREIEVAQNGVDALLEGHRTVVVAAKPGRAVPRSLLDLGSGPEDGGGIEPLVDGGLPERLSQPPLRLVAAHIEGGAGHRVDEVVVDDTVVGRIESGDDRIVVGEGEGRENRDKPGLRFGAIGDQAMDVGRGGFELVAEAEPIGGDEEEHGAGEPGEGPRLTPMIKDGIFGGSRGGKEEESEGEGGGDSRAGGDDEGRKQEGGVGPVEA